MLNMIARFFIFMLLSAAAFFLLSDLYFSYGVTVLGGAEGAPLLVLALLVVLSLILGAIVSRLIRYMVWPRSRIIAGFLVLIATAVLAWEAYRFADTDSGDAIPQTAVVAQPAVPAQTSDPAVTKTPGQKAPTIAKKPNTAVAGKVTSKPAAKKKNGFLSKTKTAVNKGVNTVKKGAKKLTGQLSGIGGKSVASKSGSSPKPSKPAAAAPAKPDDGYPVFPDNPPKASAREVIPDSFFRKDGEANPTLKQVSDKILKALDAGGYYETSFYRFRENGFALATKLEKIHEDGTPMAGEERWSADVKPRFDISFTEYLSSLFLAKTGYYRIIVFIVSPEAFSQSGEADREVAEAWVASGANALQKDIAKTEYTEDHLSTALVYVFEKPETEPSKFAGNWLQGKTHLEKAKLWSALSQ